MTETEVHVLANQKGGAGKTTATMGLAAVCYDAIAQPDPVMQAVAEAIGDPLSPVLVASIDPQASAVWWKRRVDKVGGGLPFDVIQISDPRELRELRRAGRRHVFVDTGATLHTDMLRLVLDEADDVLVPIEAEALCYDPTARTIEQIVIPCGVPYRVVVNNWDPRDGTTDRDQTIEFVRRRGWPLCSTVIRHYKQHARASAEGTVVTRYGTGRTSLQARQDYYRLALELGYGGQLPAAITRPARRALEA